MGWDPALFGMHSLRADGATTGANAGVPDRLIKRHGKWRSETAKDGYVKDSVVKRFRGVHKKPMKREDKTDKNIKTIKTSR